MIYKIKYFQALRTNSTDAEVCFSTRTKKYVSAEFRALMQTLGTLSDALRSSLSDKVKLDGINFEKIIK